MILLNRVRLEYKINNIHQITWFEKLAWVVKLFFVRSGPQGSQHQYNSEDDFSKIIKNDNLIKIVSVGDIMYQGRDYKLSNLLADWIYFFNGHLKIGNLETPIVASQEETSIHSFLKFNASKKFVEDLKAFKFDVLSISNNHALDFGESGLKETLAFLQSEKIISVGCALVSESHILKNGKLIRFLGYTYGTNQHPGSEAINRFPFFSFTSEQRISLLEKIKASKKDSDLLILNLHWGFEFEKFPDDSIYQLAEELVIAGADIILGHHPHVVQPVRRIMKEDGDEALVIFSQGNFLSTSPTPILRKGSVFEIMIANDINKHKKIFYRTHSVSTPFFSLKTKFSFNKGVVHEH